MKKLNTLLAIGVLAVVASASFAQTPTNTATTTPDNKPEPVVMLVPVEVSSKALEGGCWAQFYDERNFKGDMLTLVGPAELGSVNKGSGRQFKRNIDSLVLGPKATLTIFEHQMFKDKSVKFPANSKEAGLIKKLGFGGRIESIQLQCAN